MTEWLIFFVVLACLGVGAILPLKIILAVLTKGKDE